MDILYIYLLLSLLFPLYPGLSFVGFFLLLAHELAVKIYGKKSLYQRNPPAPPWVFSEPPKERSKPKLKLIQGGKSTKSEPKKQDVTEPNFLGAPNEVLCVSKDADTKMINTAFRFLVKRFHPDRAQTELERARAQVRTRQLTEAREKLILMRRHNKMSA